MSLATAVNQAAARAVKSYGVAATLAHVVPGVYDPATGTMGSTTATTACSAVRDASSTTALGFTFGQDLVKAGDMKAIVSGADPVAGDTLTLPDGAWVVVAVRPYYLGVESVAYECLVRR